MISITIKNIPRRLHEILKRRAALSRRSLNNEIILNLEAVVGFAPLDEKRMALDAATSRVTFKGRAAPGEIDRLKREGRE